MSSTSPKKLYEGKAKIIYATDDRQILLAYYKDDATAFNAQKKGTILGKGEVNCRITAAIFQRLESLGIPTHFLKQTSAREMEVKAVTIIPLEVIVRNIAAGSLCRQTGLAEGTVLSEPLIEFCLKDDSLGDPLLTEGRLGLLNVVTSQELEEIKALTRQINHHLQDLFLACDITLVDFKIEFGRDCHDRILLADEISPDTCRLWDNRISDAQARVLDKDRFRRDLGKIEDAYQEVQHRILNALRA